MSGLRFGFTRLDGGEPTGFDLGDVELSGAVSVTSRGQVPSQSMMIYIALVDLVEGVLGLCAGRRPGKFEFVGADSSFRLVFVASQKKEGVTIEGRDGVVAVVSAETLLTALRDGMEQFLRSNQLAEEDPLAEDLGSARAKLAQAVGAMS